MYYFNFIKFIKKFQFKNNNKIKDIRNTNNNSNNSSNNSKITLINSKEMGKSLKRNQRLKRNKMS